METDYSDCVLYVRCVNRGLPWLHSVSSASAVTNNHPNVEYPEFLKRDLEHKAHLETNLFNAYLCFVAGTDCLLSNARSSA